MSTELKTIEAVSGSNELLVTSFFGGTERGRCLQLTQEHITDRGEFFGNVVGVDWVQLNKEQVEQAVAIMQAWLWEQK